MSGTLPNWLERLLGIEAGTGEGTVWSLEHTWRWPPWVTLVLVAVAVAVVVGIYLHQGRERGLGYRLLLAAMRLAVVVLVLLMIAQVSVILQRTGLPYVAVLLDDSLSMSVGDRYEQSLQGRLASRLREAQLPQEGSRWNLARCLLAERGGALIERLQRDYKLRLYLLSDLRVLEGPSGGELLAALGRCQPRGRSTRLGAGICSVLDQLRGTTPAALIVLSDGIVTEGPPLSEAAALARRRGVPLFFVGLGSEQAAEDLQLADLLVDDVVFLNDLVHFEARLSATGLEGREVSVRLREEDKTEVLAERRVAAGADGYSQAVRVAYRPPREGRFRFLLEVEPLPGELQTENNRTEARTVEVRNDRIRVLLIQSEPNYEFRFLRAMLGRDETIELSTVLQGADLEYAEQDAAALRVFPGGRDELFAYDVVILADADPAMLSPSMLQNLADFVDQPGKGGALILVAGPRFMPAAYAGTPLARLMPFDPATARVPSPAELRTEGFRLRPTELGLVSPGMQLGEDLQENRAIWEQLPRLYWYVEVPELKPGVRVLAEHPARSGLDGQPLPLICLQYVGSGKVLFHATDETWRWRYRLGDGLWARYWVQTIRFLARAKLSEGRQAAVLSTDQPDYRPGEPVRLRVQFVDERLAPQADDGVLVVVESQGQESRRVVLRRTGLGRGTFEAVLSDLSAGRYHAWLAVPAPGSRAPAVDFLLRPPAGEFERVVMDAAAMRDAAQATKGRYYDLATADRLLGELPSGRQVPIETLPPAPLWNRWPVLLLVLMLLIGEWVLRKAGGMA